MTIRIERHRTPWGPEFYAIDDDVYDGAAHRPLAGVGSTEAEALADLQERLDELYQLCPECKSGPGEPHSVHCSREHGE